MAIWGSLQFVKLLVEVRDRRIVQRNGKPWVWLGQSLEDFFDTPGREIGFVRRELEPTKDTSVFGITENSSGQRNSEVSRFRTRSPCEYRR